MLMKLSSHAFQRLQQYYGTLHWRILGGVTNDLLHVFLFRGFIFILHAGENGTNPKKRNTIMKHPRVPYVKYV